MLLLLLGFEAGWWIRCDYFNYRTDVKDSRELCPGYTYEYVDNATTPGEYFIAMCMRSTPDNAADLTYIGMVSGYYIYAKDHFNIPFPTFAPTPTATKIIYSCKHKKFEIRVIFSLVSTLQ